MNGLEGFTSPCSSGVVQLCRDMIRRVLYLTRARDSRATLRQQQDKKTTKYNSNEQAMWELGVVCKKRSPQKIPTATPCLHNYTCTPRSMLNPKKCQPKSASIQHLDCELIHELHTVATLIKFHSFTCHTMQTFIFYSSLILGSNTWLNNGCVMIYVPSSESIYNKTHRKEKLAKMEISCLNSFWTKIYWTTKAVNLHSSPPPTNSQGLSSSSCPPGILALDWFLKNNW